MGQELKKELDMFKSDHVAVYVSDLERSRHFYASCFGAKVLSRPSPLFVELAIADFRLHLLRPTQPPSRGGAISHICLRVESRADLEELARRLQASRLVDPRTLTIQEGKPLAGEHVEECPPAYVMYFHDPDGVEIEVRTYA